MLNKTCVSCHKPMNGGVYRKPNMCPWCGELQDPSLTSSGKALQGAAAVHKQPARAQVSSSVQAVTAVQGAVADAPKTSADAPKTSTEAASVDKQGSQDGDAYKSVVLTAKESGDFEITGNFGDVKAELMFSLEKMLAKSPQQNKQSLLKVAQKNVLLSLRKEAHALGANAVVKVAVKHNEVSYKGEPRVRFSAVGSAVAISR
ncbi:heavy metal-binding domain-containing protein [Agaribacterium haliotis]|uniref:heavy metal-binding domain-containing protein n=1 Tax=Agaribacterium haliotis TaxID=2013869 RepID=UPI000BB54E87|nr:heavy metal-binding domain-containing protein [Agaribacterium haliotis]